MHTGAVASLPEHPVDRLLDLGFRVTVNTDNRLMSATTMTEELVVCTETFGWSKDRAWSGALVEQCRRRGVLQRRGTAANPRRDRGLAHRGLRRSTCGAWLDGWPVGGAELLLAS